MASLTDNPAFIRLTPILHVILERNIGYKAALDFKRFLLNEIMTTGRLIEQCLPFLRKNDGARFLLYFQVLIIGLIQMSQPAPTVKQVIEEEKMEMFQLDFEEKLPEMMRLLIEGMQATRNRKFYFYLYLTENAKGHKIIKNIFNRFGVKGYGTRKTSDHPDHRRR